MNLSFLRSLALSLLTTACSGGGSGGDTAAPPTVALSAAPTTIGSGNASTLTWSTTNAKSCTASGGWQGVMTTSGARSTGPLTATTTFGLNCGGKGGSAQTSVVVTVVPPPTLTLAAAPTNVVRGNASTLTWSTTNADSCMASGGWQGAKTTTGSENTSNLASTTTFTLTCAGTGGPIQTSATVTVSGPARFIGLGHLSGAVSSGALGISGDGSVVVGLSDSDAFRWLEQDGMQSLGTSSLPDGTRSADDASADGSVIVGEDTIEGAFRWTLIDGVVSLGCANAPSGAEGVSADGSVVVGYRASSCGVSTTFNFNAFRWTESDGMVTLGTLPGTSESFAHAVSGDGTVVIGNSRVPRQRSQAFRWTQATGMVGLGDLGSTFNPPSSIALGISADGQVIVGDAVNASSRIEAFRWTSAGMEGLGFLRGHDTSVASDASADGSVVVGGSATEGDARAFIWDRVRGMQDLQDILTTNYMLDLTGWTLSQATAISDDGRTVAGGGRNPNGDEEAWVVHFEP